MGVLGVWDLVAQVLTYPEGNTGNGSCLCGFKLGAFQLGVPVQPVVVKYNNHKLHPAWVEPLGIPLPTLVLRLMLQVRRPRSRRRLLSATQEVCVCVCVCTRTKCCGATT